jgi:hypothetical protein
VGFNVVGRAVDAGVIAPRDRMEAAGRVMTDAAYEAHLEDRIAAHNGRFVASAPSPTPGDEYGHLFPPRTRDEAFRRADAANGEQARIAASVFDEQAYRQLFGE